MNNQATIDIIASLVILLDTHADLSKHPAVAQAKNYISKSEVKPFASHYDASCEHLSAA